MFDTKKEKPENVVKINFKACQSQSLPIVTTISAPIRAKPILGTLSTITHLSRSVNIIRLKTLAIRDSMNSLPRIDDRFCLKSSYTGSKYINRPNMANFLYIFSLLGTTATMKFPTYKFEDLSTQYSLPWSLEIPNRYKVLLMNIT